MKLDPGKRDFRRRHCGQPPSEQRPQTPADRIDRVPDSNAFGAIFSPDRVKEVILQTD